MPYYTKLVSEKQDWICFRKKEHTLIFFHCKLQDFSGEEGSKRTLSEFNKLHMQSL